jgi:hypothetical protein
LIYEAKAREYFITILAKEQCDFSVTVTSTKNKVTRIVRGTSGFLNLQAGQMKLFLIENQSTKMIKLISMHRYGHVEIYLNRTDFH